MVLLKNLVEHHRHHIVVCRGEGIRSPAVVNATALGSGGQGWKEQDACQDWFQQMDCLTVHLCCSHV